jgi:hypothetical protein
MKRALLAAVTLVLSTATVARSQAQSATPMPVAAFSIELQSTPTGWSARCDSGCRWSEVTFTCAQRCGAIVDQNGLVTKATLRPDSATFLFIVDRTDSTLQAVSRHGTAWTTLSWGCRDEPCRVGIDQLGVGAVRSTRAPSGRR